MVAGSAQNVYVQLFIAHGFRNNPNILLFYYVDEIELQCRKRWYLQEV